MFFIADNEPSEVAHLKMLLQKAYPEADIWPPEDRPVRSWLAVGKAIRSSTKDEETLVVILDLGIEPQDMRSVLTGVQQAFLLRSVRRNAVFLAYTQFLTFAEGCRHFSETFDGSIDKQRLSSYTTIEKEVTYVRQAIEEAKHRRTGSKPPYSLIDSVGLRLAAAAFGQQVFDVLVEEVACGWGEVRIAALTSGHSGAFLLAISGSHQGGFQQIIVKCAREAELIQNDTRRVSEHLAELGPLGEVLAQTDQEIHTFPRKLGSYYRQATIEGAPLLSILSQGPWNADARASLDRILTLERRCYDRPANKPFTRVKPIEKFALSAVALGRASQSIEFLGNVGDCAEELGQWPSSVPSAQTIAEAMSEVLKKWESLLNREDDLLSVGQHGDLNPSNILIPVEGNVVLIDFSRLGRWPVGYDIARLAVLLRIRLTDHDRHRDWAENGLKVWANENFCCLEVKQDPDSSVCPWAMYCDQQFRAFLQGRQPSEQQTMARGYRLGSLWDLIKVLSYSDLPPFKRLWALIECWRLSESLGFDRAKKKSGGKRSFAISRPAGGIKKTRSPVASPGS